ncbi:hypothetical protein Ciccas_005758 [Cichlidogyrus casuarinus]|uniref:Uncharacterized protein n=1 Tax=Cichlidogyrus casuarinus TaxID=1844966 RepID=A0ABD2QBF0_9PLAT
MNIPKKSGSEFLPGLNRSDLSFRLQLCLWESRSFSAQFLLPLLLEKANSDNDRNRLESLLLLSDVLSGHVPQPKIYPVPPAIPINQSLTNSCDFNPIDTAKVAPYLTSILRLIKDLANLPSFDRCVENQTTLKDCIRSLFICYSRQNCTKHEQKDLVTLFLNTLWPLNSEGCCGESKGDGCCKEGNSTAPSPASTDCIIQALLSSDDYQYAELASLLSFRLLQPVEKDISYLVSASKEDSASALQKFFKRGPWYSCINRELINGSEMQGFLLFICSLALELASYESVNSFFSSNVTLDISESILLPTNIVTSEPGDERLLSLSEVVTLGFAFRMARLFASQLERDFVQIFIENMLQLKEKRSSNKSHDNFQYVNL